MRVIDSIFSKSMKIKNNDPYALSLDVMKRVSGFCKIIEKRNNYMTDGPHHASEVLFDAVQDLDEHTRIKLSFSMIGADKELGIEVDGIVTVNIIKYGFVSDIYSEYYIRNIYPTMKKEIETRADGIIKRVEKVLRVI